MTDIGTPSRSVPPRREPFAPGQPPATLPAAENAAVLSSSNGVAAAGASARRARRRHPALGGRIAATGISTTAMFTIVAALGLQNPPSAAEAEPAVPATTSDVVVVDPATTAPAETTVSELTNQPIQLTAVPVVRAAQPVPQQTQAAPVARTNGSR